MDQEARLDGKVSEAGEGWPFKTVLIQRRLGRYHTRLSLPHVPHPGPWWKSNCGITNGTLSNGLSYFSLYPVLTEDLQEQFLNPVYSEYSLIFLRSSALLDTVELRSLWQPIYSKMETGVEPR